MLDTNEPWRYLRLDKVEVIFYDDDEKTVLDRQLVNVGDKVVYSGPEPFKAATNIESFKFVGWTGEEKLEKVEDNLVLVAKYESSNPASNRESAFLKASLENAKKTNLNATVEAGQKVSEQQKALEKDSRTAEEIVSEIVANGKTEIGVEQDKDNIEK